MNRHSTENLRPQPRGNAIRRVEDIPERSVLVPGHAVALSVPRYIVRVDKDDPGKAGTHGWQVRFARPSAFFSDSRHRDGLDRGSPSLSLDAAKSYLKLTWRPKSPPARAERTSKAHPTGMSGIRVVWRRRKSKNFAECTVRVDALDGKPLANLYVGTENTATEAAIAARIAEGKSIRKLYLFQAACDDRAAG